MTHKLSPMSFQTPFNIVNYVEVDDNTISMFQNQKCIAVIPKSALSVMTMLYENILLDLEAKSTDRKKYFSDENTAIYTKSVREINEFEVESRVLCIVEAPSEVFLKKEDFQLMLISAALSYRIKADIYRSPLGSEYTLDDATLIIFHDSGRFSIVDESIEEQFSLPIAALAKIIMLKKDILHDLRGKNYFEGRVYWSNKHFQIKSEYVDEVRVLSFVGSYKSNPVCIRIGDKTFEKMVHIATSGPSWTEEMGYTMERVRELFWKSIPINTVKSIEFSKNGEEFTLINEATGDTLTLPVSALEAAEKSKKLILSDLENTSFVPTHEKDFMNEYWSNGVYAIRTGVFVNLYRDIDCRVVRFTRIKDNYYNFVVQRKAFLNLLGKLPKIVPYY